MICNKTYLSTAKPGAPDDWTRRESAALDGLTSGVKVSKGAFTLIELLVVIAIIAILAGVLLPVLHQAQIRGETAACIDHQKQLGTAFVMYANDNSDYCVGNAWTNEQDWIIYKGKYTSRSGITPPQNWISGWMDPSGASPNSYAAMVIGMNGESDNTNQDLLIDPGYASLGDYTKNPLLFICPACEVRVDSYPGGPKNNLEIRSVSMNCWVGYVCTSSGQGTTSTTTYKQFNKITSMTGLGPADLFVFMEERGESIDDGSFATEMNQATTIANYPSDNHNNAATVAFADGHVEVHRWFGESTQQGWSCTSPQNPQPVAKWNFGMLSSGANPSDLDWLQSHATTLAQ